MKRLEDMAERWRPVLSGFYEVSDAGRVRRLAPARNTHPGRALKLKINSHGRPSLTYSIRNKRGTIVVHQLVARAFIGACPPGHEVNHKDGDKTNNRADNLEYVTNAENNDHAVRLGLHARGESHGRAKLDGGKVRLIRSKYAAGEGTIRSLADENDVTMKAILNIIHGKTWRHVR